mgnify:CR=1 FL=1
MAFPPLLPIRMLPILFAIVGRIMDEDTVTGEIWFVNQQGAFKVEEHKNIMNKIVKIILFNFILLFF